MVEPKINQDIVQVLHRSRRLTLTYLILKMSMSVSIITSYLLEEIYIIKADHFDIEKNWNQCCLCVESIMSKKLTKDSIIIQGWLVIFVNIVFQLYDCLMLANINHGHTRHLYNCHLLCYLYLLILNPIVCIMKCVLSTMILVWQKYSANIHYNVIATSPFWNLFLQVIKGLPSL